MHASKQLLFTSSAKAQTYSVNVLKDLKRKVLAWNKSRTRFGGTDGLGLDGGDERRRGIGASFCG